MKYIVFNKEGEEYSVIFPKDIIHKDFADCHSVSRFCIVSAGFVYLTPNGAVCYGESESLKRKSRPVDSDIVNRDFKCLFGSQQ